MESVDVVSKIHFIVQRTHGKRFWGEIGCYCYDKDESSREYGRKVSFINMCKRNRSFRGLCMATVIQILLMTQLLW